MRKGLVGLILIACILGALPAQALPLEPWVPTRHWQVAGVVFVLGSWLATTFKVLPVNLATDVSKTRPPTETGQTIDPHG